MFRHNDTVRPAWRRLPIKVGFPRVWPALSTKGKAWALALVLGIALGWVVGATGDAAAHGITVAGATTQVHDVVPGGTYEGVVTLRNNTDTDVIVRLYVTDYLFEAGGGVFYNPPGSHYRSAGRWIQPAADRVVVPAQGRQSAPYRVTVPDDRSMGGTYWAVVMVEPLTVPTDADVSSEDPTPGYHLHTVVRYAIQVVLHIQHAGTPRLTLQDARLTTDTDAGTHQFHVDVINDGDGWIRPDVWMTLYDDEGAEVGVFSAGGHRLYPGTSVRQTVTLPGDLPGGTYAAVLVFDGGGRDVFAAPFSLHVTENR